MAFLLLLVMLAVCDAYPPDMSGKMFTFPEETNTAYVKLIPANQTLKAVTVCTRTFSDLSRDYSVFSLATPKVQNDFLIFRGDGIQMFARDKRNAFTGVDLQLNTWHSLCATWDSVSGVGQLWLDGKPSSRRFITSGSSIREPVSIILGQEQDSLGGGFVAAQSFVGMLTDVHMWDYVISPCEISRYMEKSFFTPGNVINWGALSFKTYGRVLIEDKQSCP